MKNRRSHKIVEISREVFEDTVGNVSVRGSSQLNGPTYSCL